MDIKTKQENKIINFSGTIVGSDKGDPGQTDPVEQSGQDPHSQRHQIKIGNKIINFSGIIVGSDNGDPGQTDPVEQSGQDPHTQRHQNKAREQNHPLFRYHCRF